MVSASVCGSGGMMITIVSMSDDDDNDGASVEVAVRDRVRKRKGEQKIPRLFSTQNFPQKSLNL